MKKVMASAAAFFLIAASAQSQVTCHITGKVAAGHPAARVLIGYEDQNRYVTDTAEIKDGKFEFRSSAQRPALAQITLLVPPPPGERRRRSQGDGEDGGLKNMALFYLEGIIQVDFDTAGVAKVTGGGKEQAAHEAFMAFGTENEKKGANALPFEKMVAEFIKKYPDAYMSLDLMEMFAGVIQPDVFEPMYTALSPRLKNTEKAKSWKQQLEIAKQFDIGKKSIDFTLNDVNGKPVSLSSFKGKYLLLDFWASWCGPCRAGHPELIRIYNQFKGEKFEILAVSLDSRKADWMKAIEEDKLPWRLVIDQPGSAQEVARMYHITQIPQSLLIDPQGVIVGRNLSGKSLENKLSELLKSSL